MLEESISKHAKKLVQEGKTVEAIDFLLSHEVNLGREKTKELTLLSSQARSYEREARLSLNNNDKSEYNKVSFSLLELLDTQDSIKNQTTDDSCQKKIEDEDLKPSNLDKRVWAELEDTVFYIYYLAEYFSYKRKRLNLIEVGAFIITILAIIGWFNFPKLEFLWGILVILIQLVNLYRNRFVKNVQELITLEIVKDHYQSQKIELEQLWSDLFSSKIRYLEGEKRLQIIQKNEALMIRTHNHSKVEDISKLNKTASKKKDDYLRRFY